MAKDKAKRARPVLPDWAQPDYKPPYKEGSGLQPNEAPKKKTSTSSVTRPYYDVKKIFKTN